MTAHRHHRDRAEIEPSSGQTEVVPLRRGRARYAALPMGALRDPRVTLACLRVLAAIGSHVNAESDRAWPGLTLIAEETGIHRRHVCRAIARLVEAKYLVREHRPSSSGRGHDRNFYQVLWDHEPDPLAGTVPSAGTTPDGAGGPEVGNGVFPNPVDGGPCGGALTPKEELPGEAPNSLVEQPPAFTLTADQHEVGSDVATTRTRPDHPCARARRESKPDCDNALALTDMIAVEFDRWWELVPKKVDKAESLKLFRQARTRKKIPLETLLTGMQRHRDQFQPYGRDDVRFATGPAKWLRGERWTDETLPAGTPMNGPALERAANGGGLLGALRRVEERRGGGNHG